jgi:hypothetical protein
LQVHPSPRDWDIWLRALVEIFKGRRISHEDDWYFVCRKGKQDTRKIAAFLKEVCRAAASKVRKALSSGSFFRI